MDQTAPEAAFVGEAVTFVITVTNDGGTATEDLAVRATFDPGLVFELNPAEQDLTHALGSIGAGETRTIRLTLRGTRAGTLCNHVEVMRDAEHQTVARAEACVRFVEPVLEVVQSGPTWRYRGSRADFNITIANLGTLPMSDVRVLAEFDPALRVTRQTGGRFLEDRLEWELGTLLPGQSQALQIEFECVEIAGEACNRLVVTADGNIRRESVACLEIRPAPAGLEMQMFDTHDLIPVGETTTYETRIANTGDRPVHELRLVAVLAPEMEFVEAEIVGGEEMAYQLEGRRVVFRVIEVLDPDFQVVYRVRVRATAPGDVRFRVERYVEGSTEPVIEEEPTTFLE